MNAADPIRNLQGGGKIFFCPACDKPHAVNTRPDGPQWSYNGNPSRPTFTPSVRCRHDRHGKTEICHFYITDGQIRFEADCTHELAGKSMPLPPWPYAPGAYGGLDEGPGA